MDATGSVLESVIVSSVSGSQVTRVCFISQLDSLHLLMPPKRKDVSKPSTTQSSIPRPLPNKLKFSPLRFISRIIRTSICIFALYALYKRYNPSPLDTELSHLKEEEEGRQRYEVIQVDEYKRDRVLDAFKVRSSSLLYSLETITTDKVTLFRHLP